MGILVILPLLLSLTSYSSATYCICKDGAGDGMMQKAIDYACNYGADCKPTLANGPCFNPNTVKSHCDYAVNSYFQNKGQAPGTCDFTSTAMPSTSLPSTVISGCSYPTGPGQTMTTGGVPTTGGTNTTGVPGSSTIYSPPGIGIAPAGGITDVGPNGSPSLSKNHILSLFLIFPILFLMWG